MQQLDLQLNEIETLPIDYFRGCENLEEIHISYNRLATLPSLSDPASSLRVLLATHNRLVDIGALDEQPFPQLFLMSFEHNQIESVPDLENLLKSDFIEDINLSNNNITAIGDLRLYKRHENQSMCDCLKFLCH